MSVETSVTRISDLNAAWPAISDPKSQGAAHLRAVKTAVKSLLTDPAQLDLYPKYADDEVVPVVFGTYQYTLAHAPNPASSLKVISYSGIVGSNHGGLVQTSSYFSLNGAVLTIHPGLSLYPLRVWYTY